MRKHVKVSRNRQTTCYVIAYDIPDDKRRGKIHKILLGFGKWTQYSLFECFLTPTDLVMLREQLAEYLVAREDSIRFYALCARCVNNVETLGGAQPHEELAFII